MRFAFLATLLVVVAIAQAQPPTMSTPTPVHGPGPTMAETVAVTGTVTTPDGTPLAGVEVWTCCEPIAPTDAEGRFAAEVLPGWSALSFHAEGRMDATYERDFTGPIDITVALPPGPARDATIEGRVVDGSGAAIASALVAAFSFGPGQEPQELADGGILHLHASHVPVETTTDATGTFRLAIVHGEVEVWAREEKHTSAQTHIAIAAGESRSVELVLQRLPDATAQIHGRIVERATGQPVPWTQDAPYHLVIENLEYGVHACITSPSGIAWDEGPWPGPTRETMWPEGSAAPSDEPESGQSDEPPASGAIAEPTETGTSTATALPASGPSDCVTLEADGTFSGSVVPGYSIVALHPSGECSADQCASHRPWRRTMVLAADATTDITIDLVAPSLNAVVEGYILDASLRGVPGAHVALNGWASGGHSTTDEHGAYRIRLAAGIHDVEVWADGFMVFLGEVTVAADAATQYDVALYPGTPKGCCGPAPPPADEGTSAPEPGMGPYDSAGRAGHLTNGGGLPAAEAQDPPGESAEVPFFPSRTAFVLAAVAVVGATIVIVRRR